MLADRPGFHIVLLLLLFASSIGVFLFVGARGDEVFKTFVEREKSGLPSRFPEKFPFIRYDDTHLMTLKANYSDVARQYVSPILFPLDLAFMLIAGGTMLLASFYFARMVGLSTPWVCIALALPVVYLAFDLVEDGMLAMMLKGTIGITTGSVWVLKSLTLVKIAGFFGGLAVTLGLTACGLLAFARQSNWIS